MPSGPVILNNTPLVAFWVLGQLELLHSLYGEVLVPTAVLAEFVVALPADSTCL
jgi:predicted nucleic acid-binding protein